MVKQALTRVPGKRVFHPYLSSTLTLLFLYNSISILFSFSVCFYFHFHLNLKCSSSNNNNNFHSIYTTKQSNPSSSMAVNEPSMFRSTDSWYPDAFARETESALTKALQQSFFDTHPIQSQLNNPLISSSFFVNQTHDYTPSASTVTGSGSGSDPETPGSKRSLGVSIGKTTTTKRKSRASKRSMTTFIQADPTNFRQMVQEVTGAKFEGNGRLPVVKPEPHRQPFVNKLQGLMLPTLDTSAYLLDVHNTNNTRRLPAISQATENNGVAGVGDFYSFSSFPTLESSI